MNWRHVMNVTTACQCIITLSLVSLSVSTHTSAAAAPGSGTEASASTGTPEANKPATPANPNGMTRGTTPVGKTREAPLTPANRTREVENRVRSGQMDQPVAQGEISERLNQLES